MNKIYGNKFPFRQYSNNIQFLIKASLLNEEKTFKEKVSHSRIILADVFVFDVRSE